MRETGDEFGVPVYDQLVWHLRSNHFPPVPLEMVGACLLAIKCINKGLYDNMIYLPHGTTWRGARKAPAYAIAEAHHLDPWIEEDDDAYY